MRYSSALCGFLLAICVSHATAQSLHGNTDAKAGFYPGTCANTIVYTTYGVSQEVIDYYAIERSRTQDIHNVNGTYQPVSNEVINHQPSFVGEEDSYLYFCPGGVGGWLNTEWERKSFLVLFHVMCYPGFDDPRDPESNPMCWWAVECNSGGEPCYDNVFGTIT